MDVFDKPKITETKTKKRDIPKGLWVKAMHEVAKAAKSASKGGIEAMASALPQLEKALSDLTELQNEVKNKVNLGQI